MFTLQNGLTQFGPVHLGQFKQSGKSFLVYQEQYIKNCLHYELSAVHLVLLSVAKKLKTSQVGLFTDNQNVVCIPRIGNGSPDLHAIAVKMRYLSLQSSIRYT